MRGGGAYCLADGPNSRAISPLVFPLSAQSDCGGGAYCLADGPTSRAISPPEFPISAQSVCGGEPTA